MHQTLSMKNIFTIIVIVGFVISGSTLSAQTKSQCETCFTSEIISADRVSDQCANYQIKVFYTGQCDHDLSHFTVSVPSCATISNLTNDAGGSEVFGLDP